MICIFNVNSNWTIHWSYQILIIFLNNYRFILNFLLDIPNLQNIYTIFKRNLIKL